jgi:transglutaminase-like putative cysteine protease
MSAARARRRWSERIRLAVEIVAAYARTRRAIGRAPIAVVLASLRAPKGNLSGSPSPGVDVDTVAQARDLGNAVERTLALMPGDARCLTRSLVLTRLLARRGIPAKLVIGTRTDPDFIAHAWVEQAGRPVLSPGDGSFGRLVEL